ncbi:MAG: AEC family transporter [Hyphomicrobiaceae bacterium]|nr:AEC family transporter [Hyphomicrobiaceae bacterium]MCC0023598.1 AEC family transporter [Hyphomicrobiaceae bacterium]
MLSVFASLLPVFILIAAGFVLRKAGIIPAEHWRGVELVCFYVLFPALLIIVLADSTLTFGETAPFALSLLVLVVLMSLGGWLARKPLNRLIGMEGPAYTTFFQTTTRWHGFIALAVVGKLYGDEGLAVLAIAFAAMVPILNVVNILILATYAAHKPAPMGLIVRTLVRNPLIWGIVIGLIIRFSGIALPDIAKTTLGLAGDGALGVSLLALGAGLSWKAAKSAGKEVLLATFVKLIITPVLGIGVALMFGVSGMSLVIIAISAAVPTAVNGYVLARTMGGDAELYAATTTAQVVVSFVTMPFFIWIAMQVAG